MKILAVTVYFHMCLHVTDTINANNKKAIASTHTFTFSRVVNHTSWQLICLTNNTTKKDTIYFISGK
jgi:hypothetical protein